VKRLPHIHGAKRTMWVSGLIDNGDAWNQRRYKAGVTQADAAAVQSSKQEEIDCTSRPLPPLPLP
jgi:hypothetical protein